jgi:hypothetical protein
VEAQTGARLGTAAPPVAPTPRRLSWSRGVAGRVLYCPVRGLVADGDPSAVTDLFANGLRRLLALDPVTLQPNRAHTLPCPVRARSRGTTQRPVLLPDPGRTPSSRRSASMSPAGSAVRGRR